MIYKRKGSKYYVAKFQYKGEMIWKSTGATDAKTARTIAARIRTEIAKGNWDVLEKKPAPRLADFLERRFLPYVETEFKIKAPKLNTFTYYNCGVNSLLKSDLAKLRLDKITSEHVNGYVAQKSHFELSTIHRDLRTLKRALSLAIEWGEIDRRPKIVVDEKNENKRERVLTEQEARLYLAACPQPWRDVATVMLGTGMRPGEVRRLRWEHALLNGHGGLIRVAESKSKAGRRILPIIVPEVYQALKARHEAKGRPSEGWVFPAASRSGHLEEGTDKKYHDKALKALAEAHKEKPEENPEVKPFEAYCLRHTALTWLNSVGCDAFDLARIAGHSNIRITQRYVHQDTDTIEAAFQKLADRKKLVAEGGCSQNAEISSEKPRPQVTESK
jgi:integrase